MQHISGAFCEFSIRVRISQTKSVRKSFRGLRGKKSAAGKKKFWFCKANISRVYNLLDGNQMIIRKEANVQLEIDVYYESL